MQRTTLQVQCNRQTSGTHFIDEGRKRVMKLPADEPSITMGHLELQLNWLTHLRFSFFLPIDWEIEREIGTAETSLKSLLCFCSIDCSTAAILRLNNDIFSFLDSYLLSPSAKLCLLTPQCISTTLSRCGRPIDVKCVTKEIN